MNKPQQTPQEMAFPLIGTIPVNPLNPREMTVFLQGGMTLRDYFAGQYLTGILSLQASASVLGYKQIAEYSYKMADAMLEARKHGA